MRVLGLMLVLAAAGCGPSPEAQMAADDQKCLSYGFKRGTPEYGQCRMALDSRREANRYDLGKALRGAGAGLSSIR
jgi:hypothetical protein